ncbi:unnamed protein product [Parascedosporium putredinis]|uniref:TRUD domain-containing protein n=1 Tax=Parascedosporium putredinis TaxID=1442378 RepID=A0A9P1MCG9_9PEZI|nr:unnamed protein product [Parascedosporium putredinis]CAI8000692.1 unnamed protein product [Parascedosporium putredinis]
MTAPRPDIQRSCAAFDTSIGITERVSTPSTFWQGIMRHRRTDFLVNEIQKDGTVLHLRNCNIELPKDGQGNGNKIPVEDVAILEGLTSKDFAEKIINLYKSAPSQSKNSVTTDLIEDKATRSKLHQEVRRIFKSEIDTTTDPTTGAIVASKRKSDRTKNKNVKFKQRVDCPGTGDFLHFTLFKENRDTMEAANLIARMLSLKPRAIHFAGTKDRRAATVQRCSVRQRTAADLARLNPKLYGMKTGDYAYRHDPIRLGQLRGNEFTIVVKDCHFAQDAALPVARRADVLHTSLRDTLRSMHARGWINYFGHQRFGSFATGTNKIGMLIFSGRLEDAVNALLHNPRHDEYNRALACRTFQTEHDAAKALKHLPAASPPSPPSSVTSAAPRHPRRLRRRPAPPPRGLRTLYLHAYQSYVWNHAASKRWALYGDKVVEGDLVASTPGDDRGDPEPEAEPVDPEDDDEVAISARPLTAQEAASGAFSIFDVVLPSAGTSTLLPANEVGAFYREFMGRKEEQQQEQQSAQAKAQGDGGSGGGKRSLDAATNEAGDGENPVKKTKLDADAPPADVEMDGAADVQPLEPAAEKVATILHFQLGRSAYATVAIREMGLSPDEHGTGVNP